MSVPTLSARPTANSPQARPGLDISPRSDDAMAIPTLLAYTSFARPFYDPYTYCTVELYTLGGSIIARTYNASHVMIDYSSPSADSPHPTKPHINGSWRHTTSQALTNPNLAGLPHCTLPKRTVALLSTYIHVCSLRLGHYDLYFALPVEYFDIPFTELCLLF